MTDRPATLFGDLSERPDGGFDGWCWAPDRPQERLVIDLLVNDTLAVSMVAAVFRRDLLAFGCGDGRHGFSLRLPPDVAGADEECLITARERRSGQVFGRMLRTGPGRLPPGIARVTAAEDAMRALWQDVASLRAKRSRKPASERLRAAFGRLGHELAPGAGATMAGRPATGAVPALMLVLAGGAARARRVHAALAPALAETAAEMVAADPPEAPQASLTSGAVRGRFTVLLAPTDAPSSAALLALARAVAAAPDEVLVSEQVACAAAALVRPPPAATLRLPAPLGVLIGGPAGLWQQVGAGATEAECDTILACADLALRARLPGRRWRVVIEPTAGAAPRAAAPPSAAVAQLHRRWGFVA